MSALSGSRSYAAWEPGFALRTRLAGPELLIGEWQCSGQAHPWAPERAHHVQLELLHEGLHLRAIGRERRLIDTTMASVNLAGDEYRMLSPTARPQRGTCILLRGALAAELAPRLDVRLRALSPAAALAHDRLRRAREPVELEETALALFRIVVDEAGAPGRVSTAPVPRAWRVLAEEVQHVLATRYTERLTLCEVARACGSSPAHLGRVFRRVTGSTVHRHLTRLRLHAALRQLAASRHRLTELALASGFSSHSHFTHAFRAEFGASPSRVASS